MSKRVSNIRAKNQQAKKDVIIPSDTSLQALAQYCPDLAEWPERWCFDQSDILPGQQIVEYFKPFLLHLWAQGLSPKTLRKQRDHLWMLGGEVIHHRSQNPDLVHQSTEEIVFDQIEEEGGPLIWPRISEQEQKAFDSTCRKFYKFITANKLHHKE